MRQLPDMTVTVGIIADDLTGALDASAPFAAHGLRTIVALCPQAISDLPDAQVLCTSTASRELAEEEAVDRMRIAAAALMRCSPRIVFKKIDSRMKGHIAAEAAALLSASGRDVVVVAPAIPDVGRLVQGGEVVGMGVELAISIRERLGDLTAAVPDTSDCADMSAIARGILSAPDSVLAVGARGLAAALAAELAEVQASSYAGPLPRPTIVAIGSRDPITRAQVEHAIRTLDCLCIEAPNGAIPPLRELAAVTIVTTEPGFSADSERQVSNRFARGLADLVRRHEPASLLVCGGETAQALLAELGVCVLELEGEALPGVPFARVQIGGNSVLVLTKSGGFGSSDTISSLAGGWLSADHANTQSAAG